MCILTGVRTQSYCSSFQCWLSTGASGHDSFPPWGTIKFILILNLIVTVRKQEVGQDVVYHAVVSWLRLFSCTRQNRLNFVFRHILSSTENKPVIRDKSFHYTHWDTQKVHELFSTFTFVFIQKWKCKTFDVTALYFLCGWIVLL